MVVRYVSPSGNDSNDGTGPGDSDAWLTITKALGTGSGEMGNESDGAHELWIAPGTYRESMEIQLAGTDGSNVFEIRGDPNLTKAWGSSVVPGRVRVTACNSSEVPQDSEVVDFNAQDYVYIYDIYFDGLSGPSTKNAIAGDSAQTNQKLIRCSVIGGGAASCNYITAEWSVILGSTIGILNSTAKYSYVGGSTFPAQGSVLESCFITGGNNLSIQSDVVNCTFIGGGNGWVAYGGSAEVHETIFMLAYRGFVSGSAYNANHSGNLLFCVNDTTTDDSTTWSDNDNRQVYYDLTSSDPPAQGHNFMLPDPLTMIRGLAQAFSITDFNDYDIDDSGATSETYDIEGRTRDMMPESETVEVTCPGPCEIPDESFSAEGTIKILKKGEEVLYVPIESGDSITISVDITTNSSSNYPKIELWEMLDTGWTLISGATDTASSGSETLSVSGAPTGHDKVCILKLVTLDTTASSYTEFDNIQVS